MYGASNFPVYFSEEKQVAAERTVYVGLATMDARKKRLLPSGYFHFNFAETLPMCVGMLSTQMMTTVPRSDQNVMPNW